MSELEKLIPDSRGRYGFFEIAEYSHLDSTAVGERLWRQAWKGRGRPLGEGTAAHG